MKLSDPAPRRHLHTRSIVCEGFLRDDGLWDIEARIIDTKTYRYSEPERGARGAGSHVHDMMVRLTLDAQMIVRDIEAVMLDNPYDTCLTALPAYRALIGQKVGGGWRKAVNAAVGGALGCTHIRELLFPMATVAFQTISGWREDRAESNDSARSIAAVNGAMGVAPPSAGDALAESPPVGPNGLPYFVGGCKAWAIDSPVLKREYPQYFMKQQA